MLVPIVARVAVAEAEERVILSALTSYSSRQVLFYSVTQPSTALVTASDAAAATEALIIGFANEIDDKKSVGIDMLGTGLYPEALRVTRSVRIAITKRRTNKAAEKAT